jgi:hypothetical protein
VVVGQWPHARKSTMSGVCGSVYHTLIFLLDLDMLGINAKQKTY